jgi:hypothetical protein
MTMPAKTNDQIIDLLRAQVISGTKLASSIPTYQASAPSIFVLCGEEPICGDDAPDTIALSAIQMMKCLALFELIFQKNNEGRLPIGIIAPNADREAMQTMFFGSKGEGDSVWERAISQDPWLKDVTWSN